MPTFTIHAYQDMYADAIVTAETAEEAIAQFRAMMQTDGRLHWQPSEETLEFEVSDADQEVVLTSDDEA